MKKSVLLITIILTAVLTSCGKTMSDSSLLGKWERDGQTYTFNKNGTMTINSVRYSYEVENGMLNIFGNGKTKTFSYSILDGNLFIGSNEYKRFIEPEKNEGEISNYIKKFFS